MILGSLVWLITDTLLTEVHLAWIVIGPPVIVAVAALARDHFPR
jgi:hypothetical protein